MNEVEQCYIFVIKMGANLRSKQLFIVGNISEERTFRELLVIRASPRIALYKTALCKFTIFKLIFLKKLTYFLFQSDSILV